MEIEEVIKHLQSINKVYVGIMPQGTFSTIVGRIKAGTCKLQTKKWFMDKFGYQIKTSEQWERKEL